MSPEQEKIIIFDTTLRDGEQSPGASMTLEEKVRIATLLDETGVDIIEAGFPVASEGDFQAVQKISATVKNAVVCGLSRASKKDIDRAAAALQPARQARIHTFIATSPLHMQYKLNMTPEQVLERIHESVSHARNHVENVQWSPEDGTRSDHDFLCKAVETAIKAGAGTINIPDTVGYTIPQESSQIITMLRNRVPDIDKVIISTHCHNDLGMAVANALAAVEAGARQVECTINGLGERAGNAALEEIVMALRVRHDLLPYTTGIKASNLIKLSRLVASATGFPVQYNKAIVGKNAFAHESGIHQDGMLKNAQTYEIMRPEDVGLHKTDLVMGKHSGRHAFRKKLEELGFELDDTALNDVFTRFKSLADVKKTVYDDDLVALIEDFTTAAAHDYIQLVSLRVMCGTTYPQSAELVLNIEGKQHQTTTTGDGPVDAAFNALKKVLNHKARLQTYQVSAVTAGTDAQADVSVRLEGEDGYIVTGIAADTDTIVASTRAYINALNKLVDRKRKSDPHALPFMA